MTRTWQLAAGCALLAFVAATYAHHNSAAVWLRLTNELECEQVGTLARNYKTGYVINAAGEPVRAYTRTLPRPLYRCDNKLYIEGAK